MIMICEHNVAFYLEGANPGFLWGGCAHRCWAASLRPNPVYPDKGVFRYVFFA